MHLYKICMYFIIWKQTSPQMPRSLIRCHYFMGIINSGMIFDTIFKTIQEIARINCQSWTTALIAPDKHVWIVISQPYMESSIVIILCTQNSWNDHFLLICGFSTAHSSWLSKHTVSNEYCTMLFALTKSAHI